jgi:hypothetical protein
MRETFLWDNIYIYKYSPVKQIDLFNDIATMMYKNNETRCFYENIKIELNRLLSFQTVLFEVISGSTVDKHR